MNKKIIKSVFFILIAVAIVFFLKTLIVPKKTVDVSQKIRVVTSIYPLYDVAQQIGGAHIDLANITPAGVEPHDYEPTPKDIARVYDAKLFLLNGHGIDGWGEKIMDSVQGRGVSVIRMSDHISFLSYTDQKDGDLVYDPHIWLSLPHVQKQAQIIADALSLIDPAHAAEYTANKERYVAELAALDAEFLARLSQCKTREIVTSHDAFGYLASRYNLTTMHISGLSPEEEPSPATMAEIATLAKEKGITHIFFESLVSPKLSQTIADEIGAQTLSLSPIEGLSQEDIASGKTYLTEMKTNLDNLVIALSCQ